MQSIPDNVEKYPAPAKLNLDLRIIGQRDDGFHLLESIFVLIDLCDQVGICLRDDGQIVLHCPAKGVLPEQDLAFRAAHALKKHTHSSYGADIWLEKHIPQGGGLGGGSSDAATVLMVLNYLWQCGLSNAKLREIGITLGADVPFFLFGQNAFVRGIGEQLIHFDVPKQWYVVVCPDEHVATSKIFSHPHLTRNSTPAIMPTFHNLQPFRNDMQAVVLAEYPKVAQAYQTLNQYGSARMTGSGACLFLAVEKQEDAERIFKEVSQQYQSFLVKNLKTHPFFDML